MVSHILHFLLGQNVEEEEIFMNFYLNKHLCKKFKWIELALNFVQKQYFR